MTWEICSGSVRCRMSSTACEMKETHPCEDDQVVVEGRPALDAQQREEA